MKPKTAYTVFAMAIVATGIAEELNPNFAHKIPAHMHPESHAPLTYAISPTTAISGSTLGVVTKGLTYAVESLDPHNA